MTRTTSAASADRGSAPAIRTLWPLMAAAVAALGWATPGVLIRFIPPTSPLVIVTFRYTAGLVLTAALLAALRGAGRTALPDPERTQSDRPALWGLAAVMAAYYACSTPSFILTSVAESTLLINSSPLMTLMIAAVKRERIARRRQVGAVLAFCGLVIILLGPATAGASVYPWRLAGDFLALGSALAAALYAEGFARLKVPAASASPIRAAGRAFAVGVLLLGIPLLFIMPNRFEPLLTPTAVWPLLGLAVISTIIPTVSYSFAAKNLSPILTTSFRLLTPLLAALFAWVFVGETPHLLFAAGTVFVLCGLWLVAK